MKINTTNSMGTILPRHMTAQLAEFIANHETLTDLLMWELHGHLYANYKTYNLIRGCKIVITTLI